MKYNYNAILSYELLLFTVDYYFYFLKSVKSKNDHQIFIFVLLKLSVILVQLADRSNIHMVVSMFFFSATTVSLHMRIISMGIS